MLIKYRKLYLLVIILIILAVSLSCRVPTLKKPTTPAQVQIPVSTEAVEELINNLSEVAATAQSGGAINLVITEEQLTSAAVFSAQSIQGVEIQNIQIHLQNSQIIVTGDLYRSGIILPISVVLEVTVDEQGQPHSQIVGASMGPLPIPESYYQEITSQFDQYLQSQLHSNGQTIFIESITIGDGLMTIHGHVQ